MGRAQRVVLVSVFLTGCGLRVTEVGSQGLGSGGSGGGGSVAQAPECAKYVDCYEHTGGTPGALNATYGPTGTCWSSGSAAAASCVTACQESLVASLQAFPHAVECGGTDAGTACVKRPIKLMLLLDQSGSMCITDPPGSQQTMGICEMIASTIVPPSVTEPARVKAVKKLIQALQARADVSLSIVPFNTAVMGPYPQAGFTATTDPGLMLLVSTLQSQLGSGTDFEGALSHVYTTISADIAQQKATDAGTGQLGATDYVVLLVTDGTPFPRCSANDALATYANSLMPSGIWPDSPGAGSACNDPLANPGLVNFTPGTDRNQTSALIAQVAALRALQGPHAIRFNTQLLFNTQNIQQCGPICQDIYGTYPEVPSAQYPQAALTVARYTLQQLTLAGGGTYGEALDNLGIAAFATALPNFVLDPACP